jgi:hypothetical protein
LNIFFKSTRCEAEDKRLYANSGTLEISFSCVPSIRLFLPVDFLKVVHNKNKLMKRRNLILTAMAALPMFAFTKIASIFNMRTDKEFKVDAG